MDKQVMSVFYFNDYKIDYIRYDVNHDFVFKEEVNEELNIDMQLNVKIVAHESEPKGKVSIVASFFKNTKDGYYPFTLDVSVTGSFGLSEPMDDKESFKKYLEINGTTALFPFFRGIIADITRIANVDPLIMPLINIHRLIRQQEEQTSA